MNLGSLLIGITSSIKYLGINILSGPRFKVNIDFIKRRFYGSCNVVSVADTNSAWYLQKNMNSD